MNRIYHRILLLSILATLLNCARSVEPVITVSSGNTSVILAAQGGRLQSGSNSIELRFQTGTPQLIETPSLHLYMSAMGTMPEMRSNAELSPTKTVGVFKGKVDLEMKGTWQGLLEFTVGSEKQRADFSVLVQ